MSLGNLFSSLAPVAAGFMTGGSSLAFAPLLAGAATGAGIASLRGEDPLMGAFTGGISGYGGGNLAQGFRDFGTKQAMGKLGTTSSVGPMTFEGVRGTGNVIAPPEVLPTGTKALGQGITAALDKPTDFLRSMGGGDALKGGIKTAGLAAPAIGGAFVPDMPRTTGEMNQMRYDPNRRLNLNRPTGLRLLAKGGQVDTPAKLTEPEIMRMIGDERGMQEGGYLETGMGDGVSDEIPASLDGEQDVLLSENEFVIPADVVSGLGNGSSDAGAEKLYAMMDRVRKARTGTEKMGKEITAERLMPV